MSTSRLPVAFVPHGGGPWPFVDLGFPKHEVESLADHLRELRLLPKQDIRAVLVVSAHWEENNATVMTSDAPPLLFDYYGFPESTYQLTWAARGSKAIALEVKDTLQAAGIRVDEQPERGFDHGTFVPLMLTYPNGEVPIVQLSLQRHLDPAYHLHMGEALATLRNRGIFIVGTGMTFHNLRALRQPGGKDIAHTFDAWLKASVTDAPEARNEALAHWADAPGARFAHPREEHLLPLMVIAGAAGEDLGRVAYEGTIAGWPHAGFFFG